jgi:hypothetical protein
MLVELVGLASAGDYPLRPMKAFGGVSHPIYLI